MNIETRASESVTTGTRGPSRRTLVRTAAWSVPVISTAAAAPAFAAQSDILTFSAGPGTTSPASKTLTLTLTVKNTSTTDNTTDLKVTVVFPSNYNSPTYSGTVSAGWKAPVVTGQTFVFEATTQANKNGGTSPLTFTITTQNSANATNSIQVAATATGFIGVSVNNVSAPKL